MIVDHECNSVDFSSEEEKKKDDISSDGEMSDESDHSDNQSVELDNPLEDPSESEGQ